MARRMMKARMSAACLLSGATLLFGCAAGTSAPPSRGSAEPAGTTARTTTVDTAQGERLKRIMVPLIQVMNHPRPLNQVKIGVIDDPQINAAIAGGVYVLTCPTCGPRPLVKLAALTAAAELVIQTLAPSCPACGDAQNFTEAQGDETGQQSHDGF